MIDDQVYVGDRYIGGGKPNKYMGVGHARVKG
jgi:hypothetical protein